MSKVSLPEMREHYTQRRELIREAFFADRDPVKALADLTRAADRMVRHISRPLASAQVCVLAIGGYGRRELYPYSDVDLLFLHPFANREAAEASIKVALHNLWDLKLHLGHQVWTLEDLQDLELEELEFVLALLDARTVAGDRRMGRRLLAQIFPALISRHRAELIRRIIQGVEERHRSFRDTLYQLEPDLKQAPGGLRDYLAAKWLLRLDGRRAFLPYSDEQIEGAHRFVAMLRLLLHFAARRNENRLMHRLQEEISRQVTDRESTAKSAVEALMKQYFLNARVLYGFCQKIVRDRKGRSARSEIRLTGGKNPATPAAVLELFRRAVKRTCPLSDRARDAVLQALPTLEEHWDFPALREMVRDLFKPRPGLYQGLSELYELGVLEILFPEFSAIKARVIRDFYHRYTVDEHSLLAIKNIEELLSAEDPSDGRFRSLLTEMPDAELLTLTLLLHDVGKSREGKHVERSARRAARSLRRYRFPKQDAETVLFLIRHHLAVSTLMFRRDVEDEEEVRRFVDLAGDTGRLRLLCLLTYADIKAVGPGTLNEWKKDLLWQLYVSAYHKLTFGYGEERIAEQDVGEKLLARLPAGMEGAGFERFLEGFPRRYLMTTPPEEIYQHYRLASRLDAKHPVQLRLSHRGTHHELCVVTPDRYYLFARIVGLLSYFEMNILRGYGFSNRRNTVLDFFQFDDTRQVFQRNPEERERFRQLLAQSIQHEISVEKLLAGKETSVLFRPVGPRFEPTVYFEKDYRRNYTIMEIVAPDSLGLLYRMGREISALRCNIELVLINTEGNTAVDVFYLTHERGKLSPRLQKELARRIVRSLTEVRP